MLVSAKEMLTKAKAGKYAVGQFNINNLEWTKAILQTAQRENAGLVGLSALMTTTLGSMEKTIALLRENGCTCPVMVGGAVLTPEYAAQIGADYYAKDAKQAVSVAKAVFSGGAL